AARLTGAVLAREARANGPGGAVTVELHGVLRDTRGGTGGGRRARARLGVASRETIELTGRRAAVATELLLEGAVRGPGYHLLGEGVDATVFLERLGRESLTIEETAPGATPRGT